MPKFYFDHHDSAGVELDDEGMDLTSPEAARVLALEALGQRIIDGCGTGKIAIEVRDQAGPILRVSAVIVVEPL
jgi:precorrin-6B methylase 2